MGNPPRVMGTGTLSPPSVPASFAPTSLLATSFAPPLRPFAPTPPACDDEDVEDVAAGFTGTGTARFRASNRTRHCLSPPCRPLGLLALYLDVAHSFRQRACSSVNAPTSTLFIVHLRCVRSVRLARLMWEVSPCD